MPKVFSKHQKYPIQYALSSILALSGNWTVGQLSGSLEPGIIKRDIQSSESIDKKASSHTLDRSLHTHMISSNNSLLIGGSISSN